MKNKEQPNLEWLLARIDNLRQAATAAVAEVVEIQQQIDPELFLDPRVISELIELTRVFFEPSSPTVNYLFQEAGRVAREISHRIPGCVAVFGLGFPFYAVDNSGKPIAVPEIASFLDLTKKQIDAHVRENPEGWRCPACQARNLLPDLKTRCKPCDLVSFKPRDLFKALPDIDLIVLVKKGGPELEQLVEALVNELGYQQSDTDILRSLIETRETLRAIQEGSQPEGKVPIDIHIWTVADYEVSLEALVSGEKSISQPTRSLHMDWEDNLINFWFDFIFSLTPLMSDSDFSKKLDSIRYQILSLHSFEDFVEILKTMSSRAHRLLQSEEVMRVLNDRFESWRANYAYQRDQS